MLGKIAVVVHAVGGDAAIGDEPELGIDDVIGQTAAVEEAGHVAGLVRHARPG